MAKKNEQLADLINALTANEKRYFVLQAGADKTKNYLALYQLLLTPETRAGKKVAQQLGAKVNVAYERTQLRKMLMRSLRNFHEDSSVETVIYTGMVNIEILFAKGQYELCLQEVKRHMALAVENELFSAELQLIQWYRWILLRLNKYNTLTGIGPELFNREIECLDKARNLTVLKDLKTRFVELMFGKDAPGNNARLKEILGHPMLKDENRAGSFKGQVLYYEILSWYYRENFELKRAFELYSAAVSLFENNSPKIAQLPQIYISFLSNLITVCHYMKRYEAAQQVLAKIEKSVAVTGNSDSKNYAIQAQRVYIENELMLNLYSHRFSAGIALYQKHAAQFTPGPMQPQAAVFTNYMAALCYLYNRQPEASLKLLRSIIDNYDADTNREALLLTHMAHIMVHYGLGNYRLLPHLLTSLRRFAKTSGFNHQVIPLFIKMFSKLIADIYDKDRTRKILSTFMHDCTKLKSANDLRVLSNLDIEFWVAGRQNV